MNALAIIPQAVRAPAPTNVVPNDASRQRIESGQRFVDWLLPRLAGNADERETALVMIMAQMEAKYADGLQDVGTFVRRLSGAVRNQHELAVAANALVKMEKDARDNVVTSF